MLSAPVLLIVAVPAPDDLIELRTAVHGRGVESRNRVPALVADHAPLFALRERATVRERHRLEREALLALLGSTYRGARTSAASRIEALASLEVTVAAEVCVSRNAIRPAAPSIQVPAIRGQAFRSGRADASPCSRDDDSPVGRPTGHLACQPVERPFDDPTATKLASRGCRIGAQHAHGDRPSWISERNARETADRGQRGVPPIGKTDTLCHLGPRRRSRAEREGTAEVKAAAKSLTRQTRARGSAALRGLRAQSTAGFTEEPVLWAAASAVAGPFTGHQTAGGTKTAPSKTRLASARPDPSRSTGYSRGAASLQATN